MVVCELGLRLYLSLCFEFFTVLGWPTLTRLWRHSFPHDQSSHEVFKEATVGTYIFIYFLYSLAYMSSYRPKEEGEVSLI